MENPVMDPPAEGAAEEKPADEMDKLMEDDKKSEKKEDDKKSEVSEDDPEPKDNTCPCCCCLCVCSNEFTEEASCCGCFPIKAGVILIGIFQFALACIIVTWYFFQFLNDYVAWWYTLIVLLLLIPLVIATTFFIVFFTKDQKSSRGKLRSGCILTIISLSLVAIWNLIYFIWIYKFGDTYYEGMGDPNYNPYKKTSKKYYLFLMLGESVILIALFAYFICVVSEYAKLMHGPKKE